MRAISDEAVKALINSGISTDTDADREYVCECIDNIPTIEPKRGKWVRSINNYDQAYHNYCSLCREWNGLDVEGWNWTPNFCPNCGARMKGVDDE